MLTTTPEIWPDKARKIMNEKGIDVETLQEMFGEIVFPWQDEYNTARVYFSLRIQQRPLFVVRPHDVNEIETILNYVHEKKLTIRIMNGRHSSAMVSSEVLVDMSYFTSRQVVDKVLISGAGNTQGSINEFLFNEVGLEAYSHFGHFTHPRVDCLAFPAGTAATVSVAGITCSAGIGTLCRSYSLTIDHVLSFTITIPPTNQSLARTIIANKDENCDLFWALRGGQGNNFGIISEITYEVIEVPSVIAYHMTWPWDQAEKVLKLYDETSNNRPNNFNEDIRLYYRKQKGIELGGIYIMTENETFAEAKKAIEKEYKCLKGIIKIEEPIKYSDLYRKKANARVYYNFSIVQPIFSNDMSAEKAVELIEKAEKEKFETPVSISFTLMKGEISKVGRKDTAFYPRKKKFFVDIATFWNDIKDSKSVEQWTEKAVSTYLQPHTYLYVGFPTVSNPKIYFGGNTKRLKQIKSKYDPLNILTSTGTL